jgi:outer membrane lipoprotein SlyB
MLAIETAFSLSDLLLGKYSGAVHLNNRLGNIVKASVLFSTKRMRGLFLAVAAAGATSLPAQANPSHHGRGAEHCASCGTVTSTHSYQRKAEHGSGLGVATGAVVGGLLGNHVGGGRGRTLATVAGAVGGGYAGNEIERNVRANTFTDVRVRMSNGSVRTFSEQGASRHYAGEHVRVAGGRLVAER